MKKRTFGFDEFQKKIAEGVEHLGFRNYIQEHEDENVDKASVDDLGEGESITKGEDEPVTAEPETKTETTEAEATTPIDTGDREDITLDEVKVKMEFISQYIKNLTSLTASAETVPLDKPTKEKIIKLYNIIQGIS